MPFSTGIFKKETHEFITKKFRPTTSILDVGAGSGTYAHLFNGHFSELDGIEPFAPYIDEYHLKDLYKNIFNENVVNFEFDYYEFIILGDVLEHIEESQGIALVERMYDKCRDMMICIPFNSEQGVHFDNTYEIHLQSHLTNESFLEKYKGFRPLCLRDDYGVYIKDTPENAKYYITYDEVWSKEKTNCSPEEVIKVSDTTIVTGLWNINRVGRDFTHYIEQLNKLLDMDVNLFIYIPADLEHLVWEKRRRKNTYVKVFELSDIKTMMLPFWDNIQDIRNNPEWFNQTGEHGWLTNSPQASNEWYNPLVMAKMPLLHSASCWNPFNSDKFIWIDAGITNTVYEKYLVEGNVLDKMEKHLDPFVFLSYPYETHTEIHGFSKPNIDKYAQADVQYVCRGGLFGGTKSAVDEANKVYYSTLMDTLNTGNMGTEECIFTIMAYLKPEIFRRYELDDNGLIIKYIQALAEDTAELVPVSTHLKKYARTFQNTLEVKTDLYILTFNFPEQLTKILENLRDAGWVDHANRIIVIDNSNIEESMENNALLCKTYGAIHHITKDNLGINRGRQLAAEMFGASDADYYIFFEDDMLLATPNDPQFCRNGFRTVIPGLFRTLERIMQLEQFDFLKLSYTEVYFDNNFACPWYNVPQTVRTAYWPEYDRLPIHGLDPNCPRTKFDTIEMMNGVSYITGEIPYCNWPSIFSKEGNYKVFLETTWGSPFEQTWSSYVFQEMKKGNIKASVLLASPILHQRTSHYKPEERREN